MYNKAQIKELCSNTAYAITHLVHSGIQPHTHNEIREDIALKIETLVGHIKDDTRLTPLENELLAIVRTMSTKLTETSEFLRFINAEREDCRCIGMAETCKTYAEYSGYLEQFPVMKQFNYK